MESTTLNPVLNKQGNTKNEVQEAPSITGPDEEALKRLDIDTMFEKVKGKEASFQERSSQFQSKLQMLKADIMKKAFMMMRDMGVDLNDPRSINNFLQDLETQDPDLLALFESAMSGLMPGQEMPGMPGQEMPGMPGQEMPGQGMPGMPGQGMPGQGMPGMPGQGMPGQGMPGQGMPGQGMPGQGMPQDPSSAGASSLMDRGTTNLQENMLR